MPLSVAQPAPYLAFPQVASVLPTLSASGSLPVTSGIDKLVGTANTGPARWHCAVAVAESATTVTTTGAVTTPCTKSSDAEASFPPPITWEFCSDAPRLALHGSFHSGSPYHLVVDDELCTLTPRVPANAYEVIDWGGVRRLRRYVVHAGSGFQLAAVTIGPTDSIWAPPRRPLVGWIGDSYSQGQSPTASSAATNIPYVASLMLGWDLAKSADGGTGYNIRTSTYTNNFLDRTAQYAGLALSAMVYAGGINDLTAGLQGYAEATFAAFRALHPDVPLFVLGPWSPSTTSETTDAAKWTALAAAAAAYDGHFIDTRGWITGTGKVSATVGDGNADVMISSDGTHPENGVGDIYLASRVAHAISTQIAQGV